MDRAGDVWLDVGVLTTLTKRGTVAIPKPLRDDLALHAGDRLRVASARDGSIVLTKARRARSWLKVLRACPDVLPVPARERFTERACSL